MAVKAFFVSDKDPKQMMFEKKADADARDKDLNVAEALETFLRRQFPKADESLLEEIAYALGDRRKALAALAHKLDFDALENAQEPDAQSDQGATQEADQKGKVAKMAKAESGG